LCVTLEVANETMGKIVDGIHQLCTQPVIAQNSQVLAEHKNDIDTSFFGAIEDIMLENTGEEKWRYIGDRSVRILGSSGNHCI
jgi:hypothetical protein